MNISDASLCEDGTCISLHQNKKLKTCSESHKDTTNEDQKAKQSADDDTYFRFYADISIHEDMLADKVRTKAYRLAILKNYESIRGKVVLDIGTGTGILSMFCTQAGAKKVYAIEASDMADQAALVFKANGVADKVTILKGRVEEVSVPEMVDVIVSEWMGYFLLYETMLPSVLYARDKWLKKGGLMLPGKASIYMAPINDPDYVDRLKFWDDIDDMYEVKMSCLKPYASKCLNSQVHVHQVEQEDIMAHAAEVCSLDLYNMTKECLDRVQGKFDFDCFGDADIYGFVSWFDVHFQNDIKLSTSPYKHNTHWQQSILYIDKPLSAKQGTVIKGDIELTPNKKFHRYMDITMRYQCEDQNYHQLYLMDDKVFP